MPDLSRRPTRYATAAVLAAVLAGVTATAVDLRVGPDPQVAGLQARNQALDAALQDATGRLRPLQRPEEPARAAAAAARGTRAAAAVTADAPAPPSGRTEPTIRAASNPAPVPRGAGDCARYGSQEAAQAVYDTSRVTLAAAMDGNNNGVACEQLRRASTPASIPAPRDSRIGSEPAPPPAPPTTTPTSAPLPAGISKQAVLAAGSFFGMSSPTDRDLRELESGLQRRATMRGMFDGFDSAFDADRVYGAWQDGQVPVLTWESRPLTGVETDTDYALARIADGSFDDYLTAYARSITELGLPLVIRFDQEMNGNWYRWSEFESTVNRKGDYVAAWRHIHDLFQAEGANEQVIWLWSPNRVDNLRRYPSIDNYWPGADYVDLVGMTGYMRPEDKAATSFGGTYDATLAELRRVAPGKPVLLAEVGATEDGGNKVSWVESFFPGLAANPDVMGFIWFDYAVTDGGNTNDWRVDSTSAAFEAFRQGLLDLGWGREPGKSFVLPSRVPDPVPAPVVPVVGPVAP